MGFLSWLSNLFDDFFDTDLNNVSNMDQHTLNPATGLPMMGGTGGVDVGGNPYGTDLHHNLFGSNGFDNAFGCGGGFNNWWT